MILIFRIKANEILKQAKGLSYRWTVRTLSFENSPELRMTKRPDGALPLKAEALQASENLKNARADGFLEVICLEVISKPLDFMAGRSLYYKSSQIT